MEGAGGAAEPGLDALHDPQARFVPPCTAPGHTPHTHSGLQHHSHSLFPNPHFKFCSGSNIRIANEIHPTPEDEWIFPDILKILVPRAAHLRQSFDLLYVTCLSAHTYYTKVDEMW